MELVSGSRSLLPISDSHSVELVLGAAPQKKTPPPTIPTTSTKMAHADSEEFVCGEEDQDDLPVVILSLNDEAKSESEAQPKTETDSYQFNMEDIPTAEDYSDPDFDDAIEALITSGPLINAQEVPLPRNLRVPTEDDELNDFVSRAPTTQDIHYAEARAEYVSASFFRTSKDWSLGIKLGKALHILGIKPNSPAAQSPLKVGDQLVSINQQACFEMSSNQVHDALQVPGTINIVVHNQGGASDVVECMFTKQSADDKIGIGIKTDSSKRILWINTIQPHLMAHHSLLNPDDRFLSINHIPASELSQLDAVHMFRTLTGSVTVKVVSCHTTGLVLAEEAPACPAASEKKSRSSILDVKKILGHAKPPQPQAVPRWLHARPSRRSRSQSQSPPSSRRQPFSESNRSSSDVSDRSSASAAPQTPTEFIQAAY